MPADESDRAFDRSLPGGAALPPWAVAVAMADFMLELHAGFPDADAVAAVIAASAVKLLPGATAAGVVRISRNNVLTCQGATNPQVFLMVQAEQRTGVGPCRHVLDLPVRAKIVVDVPGDERWPQYAAEVLNIGMTGVMAVRLDAGVGVTNQVLLLLTDTAFHRPAVDIVDVFAAHAAVAAAQTRQHTELDGAVQSRDVIGQAKGILMERYQLTSDEAFTMLIRTSQNSNVPVREVAGQVADTGEFPDPVVLSDFQRYTLGAGPRR